MEFELLSCRLRCDISVKRWERILEVLEKSEKYKTNGRTLVTFTDFKAREFSKITKVLPFVLDFEIFLKILNKFDFFSQ